MIQQRGCLRKLHFNVITSSVREKPKSIDQTSLPSTRPIISQTFAFLFFRFSPLQSHAFPFLRIHITSSIFSSLPFFYYFAFPSPYKTSLTPSSLNLDLVFSVQLLYFYKLCNLLHSRSSLSPIYDVIKYEFTMTLYSNISMKDKTELFKKMRIVILDSQLLPSVPPCIQPSILLSFSPFKYDLNNASSSQHEPCHSQFQLESYSSHYS